MNFKQLLENTIIEHAENLYESYTDEEHKYHESLAKSLSKMAKIKNADGHKNIEIHHKKFKVATYDQNSGILHNHLDDTYHRIDGNNTNEKSNNAARIVTDSVKKHDESPFNLQHYAIFR